MKNARLKGMVLLTGCALLMACSPALNWRVSPLQEASLQVLLPCDPEVASRTVLLGQRALQISMQGCAAGGATYAVSHFTLQDLSQLAQVLALWMQAVLVQLRSDHGEARVLELKPRVPRGALNVPQSVEMTFEGADGDGRAVVGHGLWFARLEGNQARLYHAVVYSRKPVASEAEIFFSGLLLP